MRLRLVVRLFCLMLVVRLFCLMVVVRLFCLMLVVRLFCLMAVVRLFFLGGFLVSAHVGCRCTTADLFKSAPLPQGVHPGVCTMDIRCASTVLHCLVVGIL